MSLKDMISKQVEMSKHVIRRDVVNYGSIQYVCGVDVSYDANNAFASAVIVEKRSLGVVSSASTIEKVRHPYIPGLLFLREAGPALDAIKKLGHVYDVLMVDGHGVLHPRRFGLACYIGIKVDKPTVGVAKSLLSGKIGKNGTTVLLHGKTMGCAVYTSMKPIFVSVGHKISLRTAARLVKEVSKYRIPEPLRIADMNSRKLVQEH